MKKIVVAEASSTIKSVADTLLRQKGYDVICTSDGLQAWEVIQSEKPEMVFAGLNLSGISGLELCRQVSGGQPDAGTPVVLLMGARDVLSDDQLKSSGARGRLKKPFSPRDLLETVVKVIGPGHDPSSGKAGLQKGTAKTSYKAEVMSSNPHLSAGPDDIYNLDWTDLENLKDSEEEPGKEVDMDLIDDSQQLIIDQNQYNLIPDPDAEGPGDNEGQSPHDRDEDYDWFVGEMKKEIEGVPPSKEKSVPPQGRDKSSDTRMKRSPSGELKFEDLSPASRAREARAAPDLAISDTVHKGKKSDSLTPEDIEKIADKVVSRLAATIVSRLDRKTIYEAIRSVLKS